MQRNKFGQAKCTACGSWHWAITMDEQFNVVEYKCCRCQRLVQHKPHIIIQDKRPKEEVKPQ